jgi:aldehyde dehydrogenase family 7 protein A1
VLTDRPGNFVTPTIFELPKNAPILQEELFVPILFVVRFDNIEEAIEINNSVP